MTILPVSNSLGIQKYLDRLEQIKSKSENQVSDNVWSLLKDAVLTETNSRLFSDVTYILNNLDTETNLSLTALDAVSSIAEKIICEKCSELFVDHSAASARDASLADDLRLKDKNKHPRQKNHSDDSLTYGEIDFDSTCSILQSLPRQDFVASGKGVFYDIGSGAGRAVFAARFAGDYERCVGIELLNNLHQIAVDVHNRYKKTYQQKLQWQTVEFHCGDLTLYDWSDGTVVYVNNFLFDDTLMAAIANKALHLQPGAYLISLKIFDVGTAVVPPFNTAFELIQEKLLPMSWGEESVYIYRRTLNECNTK